MKQSTQAKSASDHKAAPVSADLSDSQQIVDTSFVDGRLAAAGQRKLSDAIEQGPRAAAQRAFSDRIHQGSHVAAQSRQMANIGREATQPAQMRQSLSQRKAISATVPTQLQSASVSAPNNTGLPGNLKSGIEHLSGMSMNGVRVHYNSPKPAQLQALAYAQGQDIHIGPGQERHLPHEAWHVVQQKRGQVKPTLQAKGTPINDDAALEHEADVFGARALHQPSQSRPPADVQFMVASEFAQAVQRKTDLRMPQDALQRVEAEAAAGKFIVDDAAAPGPGQIHKNTFLSALRTSVRQMAEQVLAQIGQNADDCPYIPYWFDYYGDKDAVHIEEAIGRYAPAAMSAADWQECVAQVTQQVRQGFEHHVDTGSMEGVPAELPKDLDQKQEAETKEPVQKMADVAQLCGVNFNDISSKRPARLDLQMPTRETDVRTASPLWGHLPADEQAIMNKFWEASPGHRVPIGNLLYSPNNEAKLSTLAYIFEALNPEHRQGTPKRLVAEWLAKDEKSREADGGFFPQFNARETKTTPKKTDYRDEKTREEFAITFSGGKLLQSRSSFTGNMWPVVMAPDDRFYAAPKGGPDSAVVQHSTFLSGMPVKSAGSMSVEGGTLKVLSNYSGHYAPSTWHLVEMVNGFGSNGVKMGAVKINDMQTGGEHNGAGSFYKAVRDAK